MNWDSMLGQIQSKAIDVGLSVMGALALFIVGRWLIGVAVSAVQRALTKQQVDPTVLRFIGNTLSVILNVILVVAILGYFGVQTTTFAALIAGVGLAVGTTWGGLLAHFAAGAFLIVLRPFKVGDFIGAGAIVGTVEEIGLFVTTINTPDNVRTFVGNNKVFSENIQNFTANPYRRVDLAAQISGAADVQAVIARLRERLSNIPNVLAEPIPDVVILTFTLAGPVLAVRPYCHNDHYWQVYFDTNMAIREVCGDAAFPPPMMPYAIKNVA
ncbi:MAG TPA: mechanosensitive ion channel family protein [Nitrospirota bacterium]|nr:mechanosensitive ion channel family protein [Nitrospirota bacterium]